MYFIDDSYMWLVAAEESCSDHSLEDNETVVEIFTNCGANTVMSQK